MLGQSMGSAMMGGMGGGQSQPASAGDQGGQQKKKKGFGIGDMVKSAAGSFIP